MFKEKIATISADINYVNEEPEPEPTLEEVERTTRGMKDRKSPGCDGIPAELIVCLIRQLYEGQQSAVRLESGTTDWFPVEKGVRQGCILSPYLFSLYTEDIMRAAEESPGKEEFDEVMVNGHKIRDLRYADDTPLLSTSGTRLEKWIRAVKEQGDQYGLWTRKRRRSWI